MAFKSEFACPSSMSDSSLYSYWWKGLGTVRESGAVEIRRMMVRFCDGKFGWLMMLMEAICV